VTSLGDFGLPLLLVAGIFQNEKMILARGHDWVLGKPRVREEEVVLGLLRSVRGIPLLLE
jgi:hypothetical protein